MSEVILEASDLTKRFIGSDHKLFTAVDHASLQLQQGETLGLLGESGSGKSTLGQMMTGLLRPDGGKIRYRSEEIGYPFKGIPRRRIQILFQHPEVSFNPQLTLRRSLQEPFRLMGKKGTDAEILPCIEQFGLHAEHLERRPGELSGGELQRAALARVVVLQPDVILLDEPTSMLDVITQAQIIFFLRQYQKEHRTAYLFITHNSALAERTCDRIIRIENGKLQERGDII